MDSTISLPGVDTATKELRRELSSGVALLVLKGHRSAGKSAAVAQLARNLSEDKQPVVFISVPRQGDDAAAAALVSAASQLEQLGVPLLSEIKSPGSP